MKIFLMVWIVLSVFWITLGLPIAVGYLFGELFIYLCKFFVRMYEEPDMIKIKGFTINKFQLIWGCSVVGFLIYTGYYEQLWTFYEEFFNRLERF